MVSHAEAGQGAMKIVAEGLGQAIYDWRSQCEWLNSPTTR